MAQIPYPGRDVGYVPLDVPADGSEWPVRSARVTKANDDTPTSAVSLTVFIPGGLLFKCDVPYDEDKGPGTWHWMMYPAD